MSDIDGAAAPADSTPAPDVAVSTPNPISTEAEGHVEPEKVEAKEPVKSEPKADKPLTTREALVKAAEKVEKANPEKDAKDTKAEPVKTEAARDENGKFAPKEGDKPEAKAAPVKTEAAKPSYTAEEAPSRVSDDVKKIWPTLPENARAEWTRMHKELTAGHEKYRTAAERDASLQEFHEMAQKGGTDVKTALSNYVNMENLLRSDPVKGLDQLFTKLGISPKDYAAHILGQTPEQNASAQDATIRELKQTVAELQKQVGGVAQTFQQQRTETTTAEVTKFAADHPRFDELAEDIAFFLKTRTKDLSEAYTLAERLNPAQEQASTTAASSAPATDHAAQTAKGQKSINGAPSHGSDPVSSKPSSSIKESLRRAMAAAG